MRLKYILKQWTAIYCYAIFPSIPYTIVLLLLFLLIFMHYLKSDKKRKARENNMKIFFMICNTSNTLYLPNFQLVCGACVKQFNKQCVLLNVEIGAMKAIIKLCYMFFYFIFFGGIIHILNCAFYYGQSKWLRMFIKISFHFTSYHPIYYEHILLHRYFHSKVS